VSSEIRPLSDVLASVLGRLGVGDLSVWRRLQSEWEDLAGEPWDRHARPSSLSQGTLVVEATSPAAVSILRYGTAGLVERLGERLGEGVVREIRVRPPARGGS
jgi:predicted nucleic acid-binding Zn ribbon protein